MTQRERVLKMLQDARADGQRGYAIPTLLDYGVTTAMFLAEHLPRAQARIHELRRDGWPITTTRLRPGSYLYTLTGPRREDATNAGKRERRRWTLKNVDGGPLIADGPRMPTGESVQVVEVLP